MNSQKTTVIPFPAPSKNGVRYSAETEKQNNVIGTRLSEELKNRKLSKKEFCTTLKDFGVDVSQSALGKWTNGLTVPNAYQLLAICYALDLEDGLAAFTGEHTPLLNEVGAEKVRAYREDLIATGKYNPMPTPMNTIRYIDKLSAISESQPVQAVSWMRTTLRWSVFRKTRFRRKRILALEYPATVWSRSIMTGRSSGWSGARRSQ